MAFLRRRICIVASGVCLASVIGASWGLLSHPEVHSVAARYQLRGRTERFFDRAAQPRPATASPKDPALAPRQEPRVAAGEGKTA